jgi:hypothetical protein
LSILFYRGIVVLKAPRRHGQWENTGMCISFILMNKYIYKYPKRQTLPQSRKEFKTARGINYDIPDVALYGSRRITLCSSYYGEFYY